MKVSLALGAKYGNGLEVIIIRAEKRVKRKAAEALRKAGFGGFNKGKRKSQKPISSAQRITDRIAECIPEEDCLGGNSGDGTGQPLFRGNSDNRSGDEKVASKDSSEDGASRGSVAQADGTSSGLGRIGRTFSVAEPYSESQGDGAVVEDYPYAG